MIALVQARIYCINTGIATDSTKCAVCRIETFFYKTRDVPDCKFYYPAGTG